MKEIDSIANVLSIAPFNYYLVAFTPNKESELNEGVFFTSVESFYASHSSDQCLIYQISKSGAVFLIKEDLEISKVEGDYGILGAFEFQDGFAVVNRQSKSFHYINPKQAVGIDLGFYYKKSGDLNGEYLFKRLGDEVTLFSLSKKEEVRTFSIPKDFKIDANLEDGIFSKGNIIYVPLSNGQLLALDISTGELKWKQELVGRTAIFEDKIYCIADYTIKELDANTGTILREESMQDLINGYNFRPTGSHKVYDEYIFAMASGKPGMVAIYDRRTLKFQEVIKLDEMIPFGTDHLHWHNNKLYVLDFGKILHIYTDETA